MKNKTTYHVFLEHEDNDLQIDVELSATFGAVKDLRHWVLHHGHTGDLLRLWVVHKTNLDSSWLMQDKRTLDFGECKFLTMRCYGKQKIKTARGQRPRTQVSRTAIGTRSPRAQRETVTQFNRWVREGWNQWR